MIICIVTSLAFKLRGSCNDILSKISSEAKGMES